MLLLLMMMHLCPPLTVYQYTQYVFAPLPNN